MKLYKIFDGRTAYNLREPFPCDETIYANLCSIAFKVIQVQGWVKQYFHSYFRKITPKKYNNVFYLKYFSKTTVFDLINAITNFKDSVLISIHQHFFSLNNVVFAKSHQTSAQTGEIFTGLEDFLEHMTGCPVNVYGRQVYAFSGALQMQMTRTPRQIPAVLSLILRHSSPVLTTA